MQMMPKKKLRTVDLFAGIGGMRIGFENAGFKTVFANDFEPNCKITYDANFSDVPLLVEDIRKVKDSLPDFDILLAGFPCQPFSIAGYRKGFEDKDRGNLFFDILDIINKHKPRAILLENVKNLESHDDGNTYNVIKEALESSGYKVDQKILNSLEYGNVPQNRERIYIVAFRSNKSFKKFSYPQRIKLKKTIHDVLKDEVPEKYHYNGKPLYKKIKNEIKSEDTVYQWRRVYVRENKSNVFPTLTANMGMGGHNVPIVKQGDIIRKITPAECAKVQGFPDWYRIPEDLADSHLYKQFGNSVSVPVIERIAKKIKVALTN